MMLEVGRLRALKTHDLAYLLLYPPQTMFVGGYTVFTLSVRPNV